MIDHEQDLPNELARARTQLAAQERYIELLLQRREDERRQLATELHDDAQSLAAIALGLAALERDIDGPARGQLHVRRADVARTLRSLREMSARLSPPALDELGLQPALHELAARAGERAGHMLVLEQGAFGKRLPAPVEASIYWAIDDVLNALPASCEVRLSMDLDDDEEIRIVVSSSDPGVAFALSQETLDQIRAQLDPAAGLLISHRDSSPRLVVHVPLRAAGGSPTTSS